LKGLKHMSRRPAGRIFCRVWTPFPEPPRILSLCLALVLVLAGFTIACNSRSARVEPLIIGMELAYPPFEMTDSNGSPTGVSVDMAHALGAYLNRPVRIENIPFDGLIPALKTGKIDLIISSMTATPQRRQSIDFSDPYLKTGLCLLVGVHSDIHSISDADKPGRTIAVKKGTTGHAYAAAHIRNATVLVLDKEAACVLEVVQGKADAFIYDQMSVYKNWRRYPDRTKALLEPFQEESWAIGLRKGNERLGDRVNRFLAHFKKNGGFDRLADKYLSEQKEAFRRMGFPFYF